MLKIEGAGGSVELPDPFAKASEGDDSVSMADLAHIWARAARLRGWRLGRTMVEAVWALQRKTREPKALLALSDEEIMDALIALEDGD